MQELLQARLSAADLAATAQSFGQQDDISVIAVTRTAIWFRPKRPLAGRGYNRGELTTMKSLAPRRIESRQNSRIKELRAGLARGVRSPHIAVEGLHLTEEAVKSGLRLHTVFVRDGTSACSRTLRSEMPKS